MQQRLTFWLVGLIGLVIALLVGAVVVALSYAGPGTEMVRGPIMLFAFGGGLVFISAIALFRSDIFRLLLHPLGALARDIRTLLQAKQLDRSLRIPENHRLGGLPDAVAQLTDELRRSRREAVRAMATATARVEQEKGWLEVILLELVRDGVIVCSSDHRILLYNQPAAKLFHFSHSLGLGRSLFELVADEPIGHALERLEFRLEKGQRDLNTLFVCTDRDAHAMLQARMALLLDQAGKPTGYVLTLEDISAELVELQRHEAVRRMVTRDLRGPLASLRAAAENLAAFPDIDAEHRKSFQDILLKESTLLSERVETLTREYRGLSIGAWPMAEIHSPDLFNFLAYRLRESAGIAVTIMGEPRWLKGDSHSLMLVLIHFIEAIAKREGIVELEIEAGLGRTQMFIELRWNGNPVSGELMQDYLAATLPGLPGVTVGDALERHGSEPWSHSREDGKAILRIPLQPPSEIQPESKEFELPPRPEFYDFDLMYAHSFTGDIGDRKLRDLTYVVFDTETTGLRPAAGDEIIQIAAARVTKGRVLTGEIFDSLVNPNRGIPKDSIRFHGITEDMVRNQPFITEVLPRFHEFVGDAVLVAHNAAFDMKFLKLKEAQCDLRFQNPVIDTLLLSLLVEGEDEDHSLDGICERLNITVENRHSALGDAIATAHILVHFLDRLEALDIHTFGQAMKASSMEAQLRFRAAHF